MGTLGGSTIAVEAPRHYEEAVRAMSHAAAEAEAGQAPIRLAYWRLAALDSLLGRLEELRLAAERVLPDDLSELIMAYADQYDSGLLDRMAQWSREDLSGIHDAVFEAQGRVMLELAGLRRVPNWQDLDSVLEPDGEEAA